MNTTRRGLNRALVLLVGLIALASGAMVVWASLSADAHRLWEQTLTMGAEAVDAAHAATLVGAGPVSWAGMGAVAGAVILIVLLLTPVALLAHRRSRTVLRSAEADAAPGRVVVREGFASDAVTASLARRADILSTRVVADDVRNAPVLHVAVTPHPQASPREIADHVATVGARLDTLLDRPTRTYISLHAGLRARLASDRRTLT
ncbi:hypothetical protein QE374_002156 [Microbacterium sp. SORGH_AS428]|uniref:hypothetical protein n=1 Tax=Microbacterium sp. SORGH_AS_0428 TaxID=3041788 RepID=UPI00285F9405|nr:hypothetical protein [Microbacterium sp. SORGH_AS_0428]MDR6200247.1 hypothetical protein [Microbacterium sp. SORGH_AS_0428]